MATTAAAAVGAPSTTAVPAAEPQEAPVQAEAAGQAAPQATGRVVTDEEIQVRAYFLSLEHGGAGSDVDFWLLAERELRSGDKTSE